MHRLLLAALAIVLASFPALAQTVSVPPTVSIVEGSPWSAPVTRIGPKNVTLSFTYCTVPDTALAGSDYVARCGSQSIRKNALTYTINGQSIDNADFGSDKRFFLEVTAKGQAPVRTAIVLRDDDPAPPPPPHEHPTGESIPSPTLDGAAPIKSEFDYKLGLHTLSAASQLTIKSAAPDVVGAFRFTFGFAGLGRFDPKVYHCDATGKSHLHQFYGNTAVTPCSTYETLRTSGLSTANYGPYPLNRSAYWDPAMLDGKGNVVQPDHGTVYYKEYPLFSAQCTDKANRIYKGICVPLPNGIFFIFGYDMVTGTAPTGDFKWECYDGATAGGGYPNIASAVATGRCIPGGRLTSRIEAPSCWNGRELDTPNHRDHVSYANVRNSVTGQFRCPDSHPYLIPQFTLLISRYIVEGDNPALWRLDSDPPGVPGGTTYHADFFMAHDPDLKFIWNISPDGCLTGFLNCSAGVVSKTQQLYGSTAPQYKDPATGKMITSWRNPKRTVPIPGPEANTQLVGF